MAVANHESQITNHWKWLVLLSAAEILTMLTFGTYSAALPVLRQQWALSAVQAGAIFAGQQIGYTAAVLVLSTLTDAAGVRMIYLISAVWNALFALRLIAAYAAHNWELFGMRAWLPAFLTSLWVQRGMPLTSATARGATFSSLVLLASGLSNAAGGWLSDRLGRRRMIIVFLTASALCSGIIGWSPALGMPAVLMLALLYGLLVTADSSSISTAVAESATAETLGATLAVQSGLGFLVTAISPSLFGAVLDATGGIWGWAFLSLGIAALLGTAAVATVSERR